MALALVLALGPCPLALALALALVWPEPSPGRGLGLGPGLDGNKMITQGDDFSNTDATRKYVSWRSLWTSYLLGSTLSVPNLKRLIESFEALQWKFWGALLATLRSLSGDSETPQRRLWNVSVAILKRLIRKLETPQWKF